MNNIVEKCLKLEDKSSVLAPFLKIIVYAIFTLIRHHESKKVTLLHSRIVQDKFNLKYIFIFAVFDDIF